LSCVQAIALKNLAKLCLQGLVQWRWVEKIIGERLHESSDELKATVKEKVEQRRKKIKTSYF
jgi:hypothetical protein